MDMFGKYLRKGRNVDCEALKKCVDQLSTGSHLDGWQMDPKRISLIQILFNCEYYLFCLSEQPFHTALLKYTWAS